jgi:hypothetical protein
LDGGGLGGAAGDVGPGREIGGLRETTGGMMFEWFFKWRCATGHHKFAPYERRSKTHVYYMRECERCGYTERQNAGARGDGKWKDAKEAIRLSWEREDFEKSVRV